MSDATILGIDCATDPRRVGLARASFRDGDAQVRLDVSHDLVCASDDALDAVVCVLAGHDFLTGAAVPPSNPALARREGWIWGRSPLPTPSR